MTTQVAPKHQYDQPRPGRSYCTPVDSYDCLAPAGFASGMGVGSCPGVRRADLHTCSYCGEPVCQNCSSDTSGLGRTCDTHSADELSDSVRWHQTLTQGATR